MSAEKDDYLEQYFKKTQRKKSKVVASSIMLVILVLVVITFLFWQKQNDRVNSEQKNLSSVRLINPSSEATFVDVSTLVIPINRQSEEDELSKYLASQESFIQADLGKMEVSLYKEGRLYKKMPILSKGREGSWWETPTGNYKILTKEENHFSSIGKVWMPWSMQFYGNFFIHGWPYHTDGTPVAQSYSGGCIRLSDSDAKRIYEFANKGMPILVKDQENSNGLASSMNLVVKTPIPKISAKNFLVANIATGEKILSKDSSQAVPVASLTKIMTGVVASELVYLGKSIAVDDSMLAAALSSFDPEPGEKYIAFDLLYPLLMQSSNQAANILAGFIGRNQFISNMNKKAESLSMKNTIFVDVSGEMAGDVSSAQDLEKLLRYTYFKRKFIFNVSKGEQDYRFEGRKLDNLKNYNELIDLDNLVGIKNGETKAAGQTLAGVWEFDTKYGKIPIAIIILGSKDRVEDAEALLNWFKQSYEI